jgi:hypothetical protein
MDITRIINLFRAYFIEKKRKLLIMTIIAFAVATLQSIDGSLNTLIALPFIFTTVLAGMFFQSSLKRNNSVHFFNLPVTAGEKLVNAIVVLITLTITFYIIVVAGTYTGYYLLRPAFNLGNGSIVDGMVILKSSIWYSELYLLFAAILSVFLFGSIYFKRNAFWKTLLSGLSFLLGIALYSLLLFWIAFRGVENSNLYWSNYDNSTNINLSDYLFFPNYEYIIPIIITLFFLSLTYLRLKETEV